MAQSYEPKTTLGRIVNELEETVIALLLAAMTIITFINVVLRYGFNTGLIWGLEMVTFLFAWLVLFGVSYAVKTTSHLGVDAVINLFPVPVRRMIALVAAAICIFYAVLLLKGSWDYWANFANLPQTTGSVLPTVPRMAALDRADHERGRALRENTALYPLCDPALRHGIAVVPVHSGRRAHLDRCS